MLHPAVYNTSELCFHLGVRHAVMSPGSRNAPLTISFARNDKIKKWVIPDERSAGFIALGIAQETKEPVVLCCTSGTALLNYGPAIAEAYYREIPLIILSADRPPELIDQRDGQTIRQFDALKNHVKQTVQLPVVYEDSQVEDYYKLVVDTIQKSEQLPKGPVHINIPFKEPFYPDEHQTFAFSVKQEFGEFPLVQKTIKNTPKNLDIAAFSKILVLVGQHPQDPELSIQLDKIQDQVVILKSPLNNLTCKGIVHADLITKTEDLQPDLLITAGLSVLSKSIKQFIKKFPPKAHWHFDPSGVSVDTYNSSPVLINDSISDFLSSIKLPFNTDVEFAKKWLLKDQEIKELLKDFKKDQQFTEAHVMSIILSSLPHETNLHLGNSMPVRYADIFGVPRGIKTWCNRGTSGIDGVSSTAVGASLVNPQLNLLISGDISFFYDRNAFFHNYQLPNLRIIVINNKGGGIFRLIDGPSRQPELETYFETRHQRTCEWICKENDLVYLTANSVEELNQHLKTFFDTSSNTKLIEVFVDPKENERAYRALRSLK